MHARLFKGALTLYEKSLFRIWQFRDRAVEMNPKGFYLAFSGGKDSVVMYHLCKAARVEFEAHMNLTSVDPPDLIHWIRKNYPDVILHPPKESMRTLIIKKNGFPSGMFPWCCSLLKEGGGSGRFVLTGVRREESENRSAYAPVVGLEPSELPEDFEEETHPDILVGLYDNAKNKKFFSACRKEGKVIMHPIIDWTENDIWQFIGRHEIPYFPIYDEGWRRVGCIGCPKTISGRWKKEFSRYPNILEMYLRAAQIVIDRRKEIGKEVWRDLDEFFHWWTRGGDLDLVRRDLNLKIFRK